MLASLSRVGGSFNVFMANTEDIRLIHLFYNFGLCSACSAYSICHNEFWSTSASLHIYFLYSSRGLAGGTHKHNIIIYIFIIIFFLNTYPVTSLLLFCIYIFLFTFYHYGVVLAVCDSISFQGSSLLEEW